MFCQPRQGMFSAKTGQSSGERALGAQVQSVWHQARRQCPAQSSLQELREGGSLKAMEGQWGARAGATAGAPSPPPPLSSSPRQARASRRSSSSRSSPSRLGRSSRGTSSWSGFGPKAQSVAGASEEHLRPCPPSPRPPTHRGSASSSPHPPSYPDWEGPQTPRPPGP